MQLTEKIEIWEASIGTVSHKMTDGTISGRIQIKGQLTPEIATTLGCRDVVYAENGTPREAIAEVDLEGGCAAFRGLLEVDGPQQTYELNGDSVSDVCVKRSGKDGLRLEFRMNYSGSPIEFIRYWLEVGGAAGVCKITPLQQELDAADDSEAHLVVKSKSGGEQISIPLDQETLRRAVLAGGKAKAAKGGIVQ